MDGGWRAASMNGGAACMDAVCELKRVYECRVRSAEDASERAGDVSALVAAAASRRSAAPNARDGGTQRLGRTTVHGEQRRGDKGDRLGEARLVAGALVRSGSIQLPTRRRHSSSRCLSGPSGEPQAAVKRVFGVTVVDCALIFLRWTIETAVQKV